MRTICTLLLLVASISLFAESNIVDTAKYNFFPTEEEGSAIASSTHEKPSTYIKLPENLPSRWGFAVMAMPGNVVGPDKWSREWLQKHRTYSLAGELRYTPQPSDGDNFATDYNYPTFSIGFRYSFNHGTELQRIEKDYNSVLGDVATLYGKFSRPFWRNRHFEFAYYIGTGIGYSHKKYNKTDEVNNEFIGSIWNIYFTAGLTATYKIDREWSILAGVDFSHHSNGALYRPNKGTNYISPLVGVAYTPTSEKEHIIKDKPVLTPVDYDKGMFLEFSLGAGAKTLLEDWQYTQYNISPDNPRYHTTKFSVYGTYSLQSALLYRYARRWASGLSLDIFYSDYASKIKYIDDIQGRKDEKHSPWSVGLALKHVVYYGRFSARMGIGAYVYRHMGYAARHSEGPQWLYERIGLFYSIPSLHGAAFGFNVLAHTTKADFTELVISYPIKL